MVLLEGGQLLPIRSPCPGFLLPEAAAILATRSPGEGPGRSRSQTKDPGPRPGQGGSRGHPGAQERALNLLFHAYQAIWKESRSCAGGAIGGLGDLPNKHETADLRESGKSAVFALWGP